MTVVADLLPWVGVVALGVAVLALWRNNLRGPQPKLLLMSLPRERKEWFVQASARDPDGNSVLPLQVNPQRFRNLKANGLHIVAVAGTDTGTLINDGPRSGNVWDLASSSNLPKPWTVTVSISPPLPLAVPAHGSIPVTVSVHLTAESPTFRQAVHALTPRRQAHIELTYSAHRGPFTRTARRRVAATLDVTGAVEALEDYFRQNLAALGEAD